MAKKSKKNKSRKPVKKQIPVETAVAYRIYDEFEFEVEAEPSKLSRGEGVPDLRQLDVHFYTELGDGDEEKQKVQLASWFQHMLNGNLIKDVILNNDDAKFIDGLLKELKFNKLNFDHVIFACEIDYADDDRLFNLEVFHGVPFTVAGRKYFEDEPIPE